MKKVISITLSVLLLLIAFQQTLLLIHYNLNKDYIEKIYCVNKENKQLHCHGKCHLNKSIEKTSETTDKVLNLKSIEIIPIAPIALEIPYFPEDELPPFFFKEQLLTHKTINKQMRPPIA
jgi:hypothetical protein